MLKIGDKCLATDHVGSGYHDEPCEVIGFDTNMFGVPLVKVKMEPYDWGDGWVDDDEEPEDRETVFYPNELRLAPDEK